MINVIALIQLRAFARQYGFFLFLLWMASFVAYFTNPASSWGSLLAMSTPFVVGWFLVRFRNGALDGHISFRRGLVFSFYTFFYASLLFAVAQYVYFRFFDNGALLSMMLATVKQTLEPVYKANGMSLNESAAVNQRHRPAVSHRDRLCVYDAELPLRSDHELSHRPDLPARNESKKQAYALTKLSWIYQ